MSDQEQGITVMNECYDCMVLEREGSELKCLNCTDLIEANQTFIAHQIVDEGNMQYKSQLSDSRPEPSGHDWIASQTHIKEQSWVPKFKEKWDDDNPFRLIELSVQFDTPEEENLTRQEFAPPIVQLQDGGVYEELWELSDETQARREVCCNWCHLMTPKVMLPICQCCDKKVLLTA